MKKSGYRTVFHIYLIFLLGLLGAFLASACFFFLLITFRKPDGSLAKSDWPKLMTESFREEILFLDGKPQLSQTGRELLRMEKTGLQLLDASGRELLSWQKPEEAQTDYSAAQLLRIVSSGHLEGRQESSFAAVFTKDGQEYTYLLHFPIKISENTMYLNGERFSGGKNVLLPIAAVLLVLISFFAILYGFRLTRTVKQLVISVDEIAGRCYLPVRSTGAFRDLGESLNRLDAELREGDQLRRDTDRMREEWITNITHDLKTPLSPIRGYAELLLENGVPEEGSCRQYAAVMLKNTAYMETLIDDLKLTYQLDNRMLPIHRSRQDIVRFLKELAIDILNTPEYENRTIHFLSDDAPILFSFDPTLLTRAFRNLIINAFVHGNENTEVTILAAVTDSVLQIAVADNGRGIPPEDAAHLFDRYYRGQDTGRKPEGTGLGLAIVKGIAELHGGSISVFSLQHQTSRLLYGSPGAEPVLLNIPADSRTLFQIDFPLIKVN